MPRGGGLSGSRVGRGDREAPWEGPGCGLGEGVTQMLEGGGNAPCGGPGAQAPDEGSEQHLAVRAGLAMGPPATQEEGKEFAFAGKALGWASGMLPFGSLLTSFFFLVQGPPDAWSRGGVLVAG